MATWKHKDIWTMKADTFEVKVTRSLEEEKNIWTTIVVIHPRNYLFKKDYATIAQISTLFSDGFKKKHIIEDVTYKTIEAQYRWQGYDKKNTKEETPEIFNDAELIYKKIGKEQAEFDVIPF